jgi:hypothetical protein
MLDKRGSQCEHEVKMAEEFPVSHAKKPPSGSAGSSRSPTTKPPEEAGIPQSSVALPPGYYELYGLRPPELAPATVQMRRSPLGRGPRLLPGYLDYIASMKTAEAPAADVEQPKSGEASMRGKAPVIQGLQGSSSQAAQASPEVETSAGLASQSPELGLAPLQRKSAQGRLGEAVPSPSGSGAPIPAAVQTKMENAFGVDFSPVRIHEGSEAESMGALAYTQGADIHFAPGQYAPGSQSGQELLGHELAHVVQQSQGRVAATTQAKGVPLNDDISLENEADAIGAKAARGEPVSEVSSSTKGSEQTPTMAGDATRSGTREGSPSLRVLQRLRAPQPLQRVIQRNPIKTWGGEFKADKYELNTNPGVDGVNMDLRFTPNAHVNAKKIGMT